MEVLEDEQIFSPVFNLHGHLEKTQQEPKKSDTKS